MVRVRVRVRVKVRVRVRIRVRIRVRVRVRVRVVVRGIPYRNQIKKMESKTKHVEHKQRQQINQPKTRQDKEKERDKE